MTTAAVIVAAGRGTRAGGDIPKQWQPLAGRPVIAHCVAAFVAIKAVDLIVLVLHPDDMNRAPELPGHDLILVQGGATRARSVRNALEQLENSGVDQVLIHDGARPLVSPHLIARLLAALGQAPAAAPALPVTDALWRGTGGRVTGTLPRDGLFRAQTPQAFRLGPILAAHRAHPGNAADDVEVARAAGIEVSIVAGEEHNLKLTYREDFARAERYMTRETATMDIRTGNGFDVHRFGPGNAVWLCGVQVPFERGLVGHSDADVAMHALTDAVYGALAEGDIGQHFPPSDPQWKGAASKVFLAHAVARLTARGYRLGNADVTVICERPKIGPHAAAMRAELARIIGVTADRVSVKATTSEQLGFTGREEGIAAMATVTLVPA